jgi:hypothetical protein
MTLNQKKKLGKKSCLAMYGMEKWLIKKAKEHREYGKYCP